MQLHYPQPFQWGCGDSSEHDGSSPSGGSDHGGYGGGPGNPHGGDFGDASDVI